jgi:four helix bundle protein
MMTWVITESWRSGSGLARSSRAEQLVCELPPSEHSRGDQLHRAAVSIRLNIAEGAGLNSDRAFAKHLRYALGSENEVQDSLDLNELRLLPERDQDLPGGVAELRARHTRFCAESASAPRPAKIDRGLAREPADPTTITLRTRPITTKVAKRPSASL